MALTFTKKVPKRVVSISENNHLWLHKIVSQHDCSKIYIYKLWMYTTEHSDNE